MVRWCAMASSFALLAMLVMMCSVRPRSGAFCVGSARTAVDSMPFRTGPAAAMAAVAAGHKPLDSGSVVGSARVPALFAGAVLLAAAAAARRRVAMKSQAQGGRFNVGQGFFPKIKGAKKFAVFRKRKNYGAYRARETPRRYPLYDLLDELDKKVPTYTIISEPEEPLEPVFDVPLTQRYPWADKLKVRKEKQRLEAPDSEVRLEPLFGSITGSNLPPTGRMQKYVLRRGWPSYNYPPWLNKPKVGEEVYVDPKTPWKNDRRPEFEQLTRWKQRQILKQKKKAEAANAKKMGELDEGLADALDAMESEE